jgi:site-specific DNA-methyltransferase (adenine-specific)
MSDMTCFALDNVTIYLQDALEGMSRLPDKSFDLAIADPPYGASTTATWKLENGHSLSGFGGPWKLASHTWDMFNGIEGFDDTLHWLGELRRLVKPTGSVWIHSTYHNSGIVNVACQLLGLEIINEIVWFKRNAFPNLSGRRLTASHETILWVHTGESKREYLFNYEDVKAASFHEDMLKERGKQLRTVWDIPNNKTKEELKFGTHPTQKPLRLTERMLLISALRDGRLLVPFVGSGTEIIAGLRYGMKCVGFENDPEYFDLACRRVTEEIRQQESVPQLQLELAKC